MFIKAIEIAAKYTRPIYSISRNYGSATIQPGAATLFFVNSDGWALTCRHVTNQLAVGEDLARKAEAFQGELSSRRGAEKEKRLLKELEKKYGYAKNTTFELHNRFIDCVEGNLKLHIIEHKKYDVALIKFEDYTQLLCNTFPIFPSDTSSLQQGKILCRLGFPFPEFTNFAYDDKTDKITWTDTGKLTTPRFPIEGMVTRRLRDAEGIVFGFEMSTPGLRGQSGGPAFDTEGKVWGVQFATKHLDLNFDVDQEVLRKGIKKHVTDSAFLHVGGCIHIDVVKAFMKENNVVFTEG
jgi:hypothetical protein